MTSLFNKIKLTETTKLNTVLQNSGVWGVHPYFPYPRSGPNFTFLTVTTASLHLAKGAK